MPGKFIAIIAVGVIMSMILIAGITLMSPETPEKPFKAPFIIIYKGPVETPLGASEKSCKYQFSDQNGNKQWFYDKPHKYSAGDTL